MYVLYFGSDSLLLQAICLAVLYLLIVPIYLHHSLTLCGSISFVRTD